MKKSPLIQIISSLSKKEVRDIRKWLLSPMHNQRNDVIILFNLLTKDHQGLIVDKKTLFNEIFPDRPYDDAFMRQVQYFLLKAIEEYLIWAENNKDAIRQQLKLAKAYRNHKLEKPFLKTLEEIEQLQRKSILKNETHLYDELLIQQERYTFLEGQKRTIPTNLQSMSDLSDIVFCAQKLRHACLVLAHQAVYKSSYSIGFLDEVLEYVRKKDLLEYPAIAIYYYCYKTITENGNNDTYFFELKKMIDSSLSLFSIKEQKDIFILAINYCIANINRENAKYFVEVFHLYKIGLETGIFLENGIISRFTFKNIVSTALRLGEFDWTTQFIKDYEANVEIKYKDSTVHFSLAKLYFEKKDYNNAMDLLRHIEYDDILMNISGQVMMIKMMYELKELNVLESMLERLRSYLNRKEVIGYHKTNYKNFLKFAKKLLYMNPYQKTKKERLLLEIEATNPLTEKAWMLQQLGK
ncbi:MAG: hypothetical protein KA010_03075 [Saprospiraceae bacterium]|nr:hypothetical protein [Saprospiraceae bacterium]